MKPLSECVAELTELIRQNRTLEAMEQFYADNVTMQENETHPRVGKMACLEHERHLLARVTDMKSMLINQAINGQAGVVFSEWYMEATYLSGKQFSLTEISVQQWRNGQIVSEKFYYNTITQKKTD